MEKVVVNLIKLEMADIEADGGAGTTFTEIPVVHEDTFTYEDPDPETKDYKDVNGNTYYTTKKPSAPKMNASIGRYDLDLKSKLQGGTYSNGKWHRSQTAVNVEKTIRGTTEDGVVITFPRASVMASGSANEKAIGLKLVFTALKPTKSGEDIEIWDDGSGTP